MRLATVSWLDEGEAMSRVAVHRTIMMITAQDCRFKFPGGKIITVICLLLSNTSTTCITPYKYNRYRKGLAAPHL